MFFTFLYKGKKRILRSKTCINHRVLEESLEQRAAMHNATLITHSCHFDGGGGVVNIMVLAHVIGAGHVTVTPLACSGRRHI